jgi:hypothetical protein
MVSFSDASSPATFAEMRRDARDTFRLCRKGARAVRTLGRETSECIATAGGRV